MSSRANVLFVILLAICLAPAIVRSEPSTEPTSIPTTGPTTQPSTAIDANDSTAITAALDTEATIVGTVETAAWSGSGKVMLVHFADVPDTNLTAVLFSKNKEPFDKAFGGDVAAALNGAKVQIKGELKLWATKSGKPKKPEIVLDKPENVKILSAPPATAPAAVQRD